MDLISPTLISDESDNAGARLHTVANRFPGLAAAFARGLDASLHRH
jgi:hypothetical protein